MRVRASSSNKVAGCGQSHRQIEEVANLEGREAEFWGKTLVLDDGQIEVCEIGRADDVDQRRPNPSSGVIPVSHRD